MHVAAFAVSAVAARTKPVSKNKGMLYALNAFDVHLQHSILPSKIR